jgi:hypothetical protein
MTLISCFTIIVLDGVLGLAHLDDLDQLIHNTVLDVVLGLARLDDLIS